MLEKISGDLKEAMKARDEKRLSVLRMISSALQGKQIEKRAKVGDQSVALTDDEVLAVLKHEAKKRQDAIAEFGKAGRAELAGKEAEELEVIKAYLPAEMGDAELEAIVSRTLSAMGEVTEKDFGKAMGAVMKETKGQASGDRVSALVKKYLAK